MLKGWLRFFRVVNLPTVPGDVWMGAVAFWAGAGVVIDYGTALPWATLAAACLYLFGLADNDIVGAKTDVGRPIPDGQISLRAARIARALCLAGTMAFGLTPDLITKAHLPGVWWVAAFALAVGIVVYNRTKRWWLMGLCRGLDVVCGGLVAFAGQAHFDYGCERMPRSFAFLGAAALAMTVYVAAVTKYSEGEEGDPSKRRRMGWLIAGIVVLQAVSLHLCGSGLALLALLMLVSIPVMKKVFPEVSAS